MTKKTILAVIFLTVVSFSVTVYAAEQTETERLVRRMGPPAKAVEQDKITLESYYEPSNILQGARTGRWSEITNTFGYAHKNLQGYVSVSQFDRFDVNDYAVNVGSYLTFKDSYAHIEAGAGWDIDYIYKIQTTFEYAHKLYKGLFWQVGYNYRNYNIGDSHILYPGLIYYFGDHYITADYGAGFVDGRDTASFGTLKGNFAITKFLRFWIGGAYGERLYDIYGLDARDEVGYILFTGLTFILYKDISAGVGVSYSHEAPKFIKRSLISSISLKF